MPDMLAGTARRLMQNTYTRVARTPATTSDAYHTAATTDALPVSGLLCRYHPKGTVALSAAGDLVNEDPELHVLPDDPLQRGDTVLNILSRDGDLLLAGPLYVTDITPRAGRGALAEKIATLGGALVGS